MNTQPEALRLAKLLDEFDVLTNYEAASELRHLHALNAELLEALKCAVGGCASPNLWLEHARAAIAKATGEQA